MLGWRFALVIGDGAQFPGLDVRRSGDRRREEHGDAPPDDVGHGGGMPL